MLTAQVKSEMSSQSPAFRLTVARRMEPKALRDRVGRRIRAARLKEGLEPRDLAYKLDINDRTLERWETGEAYPQLRNRTALAAKLEQLSLDDLQPDLEAEEREVRDQLDRIEKLLARLVDATPSAQQQAKGATQKGVQRSRQKQSGSPADQSVRKKADQA